AWLQTTRAPTKNDHQWTSFVPNGGRSDQFEEAFEDFACFVRDRKYQPWFTKEDFQGAISRKLLKLSVRRTALLVTECLRRHPGAGAVGSAGGCEGLAIANLGPIGSRF